MEARLLRKWHKKKSGGKKGVKKFQVLPFFLCPLSV